MMWRRDVRRRDLYVVYWKGALQDENVFYQNGAIDVQHMHINDPLFELFRWYVNVFFSIDTSSPRFDIYTFTNMISTDQALISHL